MSIAMSARIHAMRTRHVAGAVGIVISVIRLVGPTAARCDPFAIEMGLRVRSRSRSLSTETKSNGPSSTCC